MRNSSHQSAGIVSARLIFCSIINKCLAPNSAHHIVHTVRSSVNDGVNKPNKGRQQLSIPEASRRNDISAAEVKSLLCGVKEGSTEKATSEHC